MSKCMHLMYVLLVSGLRYSLALNLEHVAPLQQTSK